MTYRVTRHHGGATIGDHPTEMEAIATAQKEARRTGERHDVYEGAHRLVACYPFTHLWEAELAGLPGSEYVRRHQEAALVGRR